MQPVPAPRIPANVLRPGRHWYVTAATIAVLLTVLGVAIALHRFHNATDAVDTEHRFANGDTVTLRLDPESDNALWVEYPGPSPGPECDISGPGDPAFRPGTDVALTWDETWDLLYTIDVPQKGAYTVTCSSHALSHYAVGSSEGSFAFAGWLVVALLFPLLGLGICAAIVVVTAVRRSRHRKRLLADGQAPPDGPQGSLRFT